MVLSYSAVTPHAHVVFRNRINHLEMTNRLFHGLLNTPTFTGRGKGRSKQPFLFDCLHGYPPKNQWIRR